MTNTDIARFWAAHTEPIDQMTPDTLAEIHEILSRPYNEDDAWADSQTVDRWNTGHTLRGRTRRPRKIG